MKAIIVEDELKGLNNLKAMLESYCEDVEVVGEARDLKEAKDLLESPGMEPDVAFLDINLPDGLVFQLLNELHPQRFEVVFVTAFDKYAIKACEYSSIGYIVKPIDPDQLQQAVQRVRQKREYKNPAVPERLQMFQQVYQNPNSFDKISIAANDAIYFVKVRDIIRFEGEDNYTHIFLQTGEKITVAKTLKAFEGLLEEMNFFRVHKKHMVNLNYLRKFVKEDGGFLIMDDGKELEVSRRRRPAFLEKMKALQRPM